MAALEEATHGVSGAIQVGDTQSIASRIASDLRAEYQREANAFTSHLGDQRRFKLSAAWKQREMNRYAREVGQGISRTLATRKARLQQQAAEEIAKQQARRKAGKVARAASEVRAEYAEKYRDFLRYKQRQLDEILIAHARLEAQTDVLVHSGLVDPERDRIMYFAGSPDPCPLCADITGGNPYTVEQARSIGGKAHPSCRDSWGSFSEKGVDLDKRRLADQWHVAKDVLNVARQQVRDGTTTLWAGQPVTPAAGSAITRERGLRPLRQPWRQIPGYVEDLLKKKRPPSSVYGS